MARYARSTPTLDLHRAALTRAYRTLAQGLGGSAVVTALVALVAALGGDADTLRVAILAAVIAVGTALVAAIGSFWQGVASGLPEASAPVVNPLATRDRIDLENAIIDALNSPRLDDAWDALGQPYPDGEDTPDLIALGSAIARELAGPAAASSVDD